MRGGYESRKTPLIFCCPEVKGTFYNEVTSFGAFLVNCSMCLEDQLVIKHNPQHAPLQMLSRTPGYEIQRRVTASSYRLRNLFATGIPRYRQGEACLSFGTTKALPLRLKLSNSMISSTKKTTSTTKLNGSSAETFRSRRCRTVL